MTEIRCVLRTPAVVGEGPLWHPEEQALYWVDIKRPTLHRFDPGTGENRSWPMPERIGCIAFRRQGGLVAALASGFAWIELPSGRVQYFADPEKGLPGNRFNDGRCDRRGRFFAGTMDNGEEGCTGSLYRLEADLAMARVRPNVHLSNGLGWSPDDRVMYFTDSLRRTIYAFDYDIASGALSGERVFAAVPEDAGLPDGLCVDADGFVWSAHWGGGRLTRYAADGRIDDVVEMPVPQPSSCTFGGADLRTLYVTSASAGLSAEDLAKAPESGSVFALDVGVAGLPEPKFAG